jgi:hypothetical protein
VSAIRDPLVDHLLTPQNAAMIAGTSVEAHRAGIERVALAGGQPVSWVALAYELQRDWARLETVEAVVEIVLTEGLLKE